MTTFAMDRALLAADRAGRWIDADGRLHVPVSHISKANICAYVGREIPGFEALGLQADRLYKLWRHPDELAKGAPTFNNIPLLDLHVAVSADDPKKDRIVGSTGTDAAWSDPYLDNSLVVWDAAAIELVETGEQKELSCAYRYTADMTPGVSAGEAYDGIMRGIIGNHVALVETGRAGHDVIVGDSKKVVSMAMLQSRKALMAQGALFGALSPKLGFDAIGGMLTDVTRANFKEKQAAVVAKIKTALAEDAEIAEIVEKVEDLLEKLPDAGDPEDDDLSEDENPDETEEEKKARLAKEAKDKKAKDAKRAADKAAKDKAARDADPDPDKDDDEKEKAKDAKKAMDAAITGAVQSALARRDALEAARETVRPHVGVLTQAFDTAESVYKFALEQAGYDLADVPPAAFGPMVRMLPKPSDAKPRIAMDATGDAAFEKRFPHAARFGHA